MRAARFSTAGAHAGIGEEQVFAGNASFCAGKIKCDGVQIRPHAPEADRGIDAGGEETEPDRQVVEHIDGRNVQNAPLGAEREG